jgi:DNA-binding winged helix-turn-helix (wHTH) protein/TolB-like protein
MKVSTCLYSYRFERFELQPSERRLLAAGVPAVVDPRAFDVLIALVERAGHLVTKEELFSLVWPRLVVEENNLQVQVSALRKILGPAAIATVSGQGYRFTLEVSREVMDAAPPAIAAKSHLPRLITSFTGSGRELADVKNAHEQAARRHPLAQWSRWQWIAGGAAVFLIAGAGTWLLQTTKTSPVTTATAEPPALSIAILPFAAPDDEQLAKMLLPEITATFGRVARSARIASPGLVALYKGKQVDTRAIGREVNVRYVAEGEIRRTGDTRLFSARLIDADSGAQIWSERLEVPAVELPASNDAFATRVGVHLWSALVRAERERAAHQSPTSLTAIDFWLRGGAIDDESSLSAALAARKLYEKALQLDPRLVCAMMSLGVTYQTEVDLDPQADGDRLRRELDELSLRAVATDRTDWRAWFLRGYALTYNSRWEEVLDSTAELQRIEPNLTWGFGQRAVALISLGRPEEALAQVDQGLTLDPSGPDVAYLMRQKCKAYSYMGQYEKAIATCEKAATLKEMLSPYIYLTAVLAQQGEMDKAASAKMRLLKLNPGFSIARFRHEAATVARNPVWVQRAETYVIPGLRKAGIPEK